MSIRAAPEHHQLIRDVATALRTRSELPDVLHGVLQMQHDGVTRDTDVLQSILERLKALEQMAETKTAKPRQSRPAAAGKRKSKVTDDVRSKIYDMQAGGHLQKDIAADLGLSPATVCTVLKKPR